MLNPKTAPTVIVGGGLAGMSAAYHLASPYVLVERADRLGGLAITEERDGFRFDRTGHWLHLRDASISAWLRSALGDELAVVDRIARVYSHGVLTRYPFQANLHGLPPAVIHECLLGLIECRMGQATAEPRNFEQYIYHHFGTGIAKHFMIPYNAKLWGVHPREITSAWCSRFVPIPSISQVVAGAVGAGPTELGYNVQFHYPKRGGIGTVSAALGRMLPEDRIRLGTAVERIDPVARQVSYGGQRVPYRAVISTIPLPQLLDRIDGLPSDVLAARARLRATQVQYLNVGTRTLPPENYHWVYVPEERLPFYRVGIYSNAMPSMAPPGCASLYVELSRRGQDLPDADEIRDAVHALVEIRAIRAAEDVVIADPREIACAYVVFDEHYEAALATIFAYLGQNNIVSCGRYGSWIYNAMEDSLIAGREAALTVDRLGQTTEQRTAQ